MSIAAVSRSTLIKPLVSLVQNPSRNITLVAEAFTKPCVADPKKCLCASRVSAPAAQWFLEQLAQSSRQVMRRELQSPVGRMALNQLFNHIGLADAVQVRQCVKNFPKFPALKVENTPENLVEREEREEDAKEVQNQVEYYLGVGEIRPKEEYVVL